MPNVFHANEQTIKVFEADSVFIMTSMDNWKKRDAEHCRISSLKCPANPIYKKPQYTKPANQINIIEDRDMNKIHKT